MVEETDVANKPHRPRQSGRKALKKKAKGKNPKAFTFKSAVRAGRAIRRAADIVEKKTRIPETDRTPLEPPPLAVVITTLMRCLIKNYTRQSLHQVNGPVTVVTGRKRRITLMECNNDINSMIDVSKVADLVLLLIDASFGFEMEVFEFLHICQAHGMPKIIGVLTHLDLIKSAKRLKKTKKELKQRFWVEIYQGAKLFNLSGMVNEQYSKNDVKNLARFISVVRYHPPTFRTLHPYLIMDRMEDLTDAEKIHSNQKCDRTVSCYGYVRGSNFQNHSTVHMPGVGDFRISEITSLPDPCPLPEKEKKRSLSDKEKLIYAPFSGVGGIMLDKDAVYIELGGSHSHAAVGLSFRGSLFDLAAIKDNFVTGNWGLDEDAEALLNRMESEYKFYQEMKETLNQQSETNKSAFAMMNEEMRVQFEGYRPGLYVRIKLDNVPYELVNNFDSAYPYLLCGLLPGEENVGFVQVRIKRHRWHNRILKSYDPLIMSLGWRRFQSLMVYMVQDHNGRNRLLKYTPEHMHCCALFWGPLTPQNTGFIAVQSVASTSKEFRLAANGVVLNLDKSLTVVKKLKLIGTPYKVYTKSAFVEGMFSSTLEVAKFEGAALRTVSGLRGQIKKALRSPPGAFRASFEDKILLRDIVFLRAWYPVEIPKFYATVTNLLYTGEEKSKWQGVRTVGQLRFEMGLKPEIKEDSLYKPIERKPHVYAPLVIPKHLEQNLPFAQRPKYAEIVQKSVIPKIIKKHTAVVLEPHESKVCITQLSAERRRSVIVLGPLFKRRPSFCIIPLISLRQCIS
ncbi:unnamed protein product [Soboliphyme baturini]|uniref:Bms1-type G domain-containing protein n=1 Tax=Soboliphyme baturini TaxID=241478 RepID=A0A183IFN7_9BILA|nr:unnamed protein product [Soboliphyme baturini]